jgi:hypothetical protein
MSTINPFGTSTDSATIDLVPIKSFGCTVVDFNVSADWSSQAGSLSFNLIEDEVNGDRLVIPVLGSPHLFELKDTNGNLVFQYIGLVDSFSRSSSNSKMYSVTLTSPLTILDSSQVILNNFVGLGGSVEGNATLTGLEMYNFGHRNSSINVSDEPGVNHWWNVSNLINVFGILENDSDDYKVPFSDEGCPLYGDYGHSSRSDDGIPLVKAMWALHMGINHLPQVSQYQKQRTHGGNLLFGRHNYNVISDAEGIPYYYHVDILGFYNQVKSLIGPQYRIGGDSKSIREIINDICQEANLEYFCYIDLYNDTSVGSPTLQEDDPNWTSPANCSWTGLNTNKFHIGGKYGGTIRIQTVNKNAFFNANRPFSNIAYNIIGLETPDFNDSIWLNNNGIHPGKRPSNYSDPLDSAGLDSALDGFTGVGTRSYVNGGSFPVAGGHWDSSKLSDIKLKNSDVSIKLNDFTTMKVITGGYQTRLVTVNKEFVKHYWGDITIPNVSDPRQTADTETDSLGLNESSTKKIPVVTALLDPIDIDDFILIDMKDIFGNITIAGVLQNGIYAASMLEIRTAMGGGQDSFEKWFTFIEKFKPDKLCMLREYFFPNCISNNKDKEEGLGEHNNQGGAGYSAIARALNLHNEAVPTKQPEIGRDVNDEVIDPLSTTPQYNVLCVRANKIIERDISTKIHEKVKSIGDTHYGKSWYVPVPEFKTKQDLNGNNLVGNFERSWELTDSAYVEPSTYYSRYIPQTNDFVADGKVAPFVNYNHNFLFPSGTASNNMLDESYGARLQSNLSGKSEQFFNFSEYDVNQLCITKYNASTINEFSVIHAGPESIDSKYSFIPFAYETYYARHLIPFWDLYEINMNDSSSIPLYYAANASSKVSSTEAGQCSFAQTSSSTGKRFKNSLFDNAPSELNPPSVYNYSTNLCDKLNPRKFPWHTSVNFLSNAVNNLSTLDYEDNGRFQFAFVKITTNRVFLPQIKEDNKNPMGNAEANLLKVDKISKASLPSPSVGKSAPAGKPHSITKNNLKDKLTPFPICICPVSFNYPQISNRYIYGPWITGLNSLSFRGKIEYERDESLVPENFLIPTNFGQFGDFTLSQTSGLAGLNLAAQGRANAIDNFALFAVEEGSFTIPRAPAIKRIGDTLYGLQQVTDIRISMSSNNVETTYSFKTISPRFGKNNRDIEKNLTKISNKIKKFKLR